MARRASAKRRPSGGTVSDETLRRVIFQTFGHQRFTQDSPILPDVWVAFARGAKDERQDLILTPHSGNMPGAIAVALEKRLGAYHNTLTKEAVQQRARIAYSRSSVVAALTFDELLCVVVPMTTWWHHLPADYTTFQKVREHITDLKRSEVQFREIIKTSEKWDYFRFVALAGLISVYRDLPDPEAAATTLLRDSNNFDQVREVALGFLDLVKKFEQVPIKEQDGTRIWNISVNRSTVVALFDSRAAVKGDAAHNLFDIKTDGLAWAVVDCGIDATHPAFLDRAKAAAPPAGDQDIPIEQSRVRATYDFAFLRDLLALQADQYTTASGRVVKVEQGLRQELKDLKRRVGFGREIDWDVILPIITIPHTQKYEKPAQAHGTHVAGILAGNWPKAENDERVDLVGLCPDLQLYDFRVFDHTGRGDEFTFMAALQVVAFLNRNRDNPVIHGVNLSLSLKHEVISYACGRTPICEECGRLVGDGVVVVAAAGNQGFEESLGTNPFGTYRGISITDPGNAEWVITVGATHRNRPHSYGVSYFSSRGPTGDGRRKPDIVAPGEKITAPIPNRGSKRMDGTSMAAPHVSGAAALLMARHRELIGRPNMIKQILCKSATDLGREANFQGAGMLDILRALQSV
jgi:serine protease AprX